MTASHPDRRAIRLAHANNEAFFDALLPGEALALAQAAAKDRPMPSGPAQPRQREKELIYEPLKFWLAHKRVNALIARREAQGKTEFCT